MTKSYLTRIGVMLAGPVLATSTRAACIDPNNWLKVPGPDVKMLINFKEWSPQGEAEVPSDDGRPPYPPTISAEKLHAAGQSSLPADKGGGVAFYEPDGKGVWRVCRVDWWTLSEVRTGESIAREFSRQVSNQYSAQNPVLARLSRTHQADLSALYFYDIKGRIERIERADFEHPKAQPTATVCRRYDDQDRVVLHVTHEHQTSVPRGSLTCVMHGLSINMMC